MTSDWVRESLASASGGYLKSTAPPSRLLLDVQWMHWHSAKESATAVGREAEYREAAVDELLTSVKFVLSKETEREDGLIVETDCCTASKDADVSMEVKALTSNVAERAEERRRIGIMAVAKCRFNMTIPFMVRVPPLRMMME